MAINYTPEFNKKIRSILKNYNRRVGRLEAKGFKTLPPKITASSLKLAYTNRKQLDAKLRQLQNFSQNKLQKKIVVSKDNVSTSRYDYESYQLNKKVAKKKIEHLLELNRKRDKAEGHFLPSQRTRALMADLRTLQLTDKKKYSYQSYKASKRMASRYTDRRAESDKQFYENFFGMLWSNQQYADIDPDIVKQAEDLMKQLTPEQLLEMYNSEPDINRLVEDYNIYTDTDGEALTDVEEVRARVRFEMIMDELPTLIEKYKKF